MFLTEIKFIRSYHIYQWIRTDVKCFLTLTAQIFFSLIFEKIIKFPPLFPLRFCVSVNGTF